MKKLSSSLVSAKTRPIRVMQFGEGNFLRAFADYMIDIANEKEITDMGIAVVKPIEFGSLAQFDAQDNLYTVILRGRMDGALVNDARVVSAVQKTIDPFSDYAAYTEAGCLETLRFVLSNTTEAGIVFDAQDKFENTPPLTYPGKLTKLLYERYQKFNGAADKGLIIIPCELIEQNGNKLHNCVTQLIDLWNLGDAFAKWVDEACVFCCTLVDRIVTGYPRDTIEETNAQLGYLDELIATAEPFGLWVIESKKDVSAELPLDRAGMPVVFTDDQTPYRERKVRILNGAHTSTVLAAYLAGFDIVGEMMQDSDARKLMETIVYKEIAPTVKLPQEEVMAFAASVFERFENPFIKHRLLDISLNSVSKWKSRILPSFRDAYHANGEIPRLLTFSFAALMAFYSSDCLENGVLKGERNGVSYDVKDDAAVLSFFAEHSKSLSTEAFVEALASNTAFWGEDLTAYRGFAAAVAADLDAIRSKGMRMVIHELVQ